MANVVFRNGWNIQCLQSEIFVEGEHITFRNLQVPLAIVAYICTPNFYKIYL